MTLHIIEKINIACIDQRRLQRGSLTPPLIFIDFPHCGLFNEVINKTYKDILCRCRQKHRVMIFHPGSYEVMSVTTGIFSVSHRLTLNLLCLSLCYQSAENYFSIMDVTTPTDLQIILSSQNLSYGLHVWSCDFPGKCSQIFQAIFISMSVNQIYDNVAKIMTQQKVIIKQRTFNILIFYYETCMIVYF